VESINEGSLPNVNSAWENIVSQKTDAAIENAKRAYKAALMESAMFQDLKDILGPDGAHAKAHAKGNQVFLQESILNALNPTRLHDSLLDIQKNATDLLWEVISGLGTANEKENKAKASEVARELQTWLSTALKSNNPVSTDSLRLKCLELETQYLKIAKGDLKHALLLENGWTAQVTDACTLLAKSKQEEAVRNAESAHVLLMQKAKHDYTVLQELYQVLFTFYFSFRALLSSLHHI
jgi:hypothetical protein